MSILHARFTPRYLLFGVLREWYTGLVKTYSRKPNTACKVCGLVIYRRPSEINSGQVFCSSRCYGISTRKEHPCVVCEKPILAGENKKTCSRSCANSNRAGIEYKTGRKKDKVTTGRAIKLRVIELRGPSCERCHYNKTEILQVHHKNRNHEDNALDNLELICPNCHYEEHYLEKSWLGGNVLNGGVG